LHVPPAVSVWHRPARHVGRRVLVYDAVDSTNNIAAELAHDSANAGTAVLAGEQTAGRGQFGRSWQSPPGLGVWLSVVLAPPPDLRRPVLLTAWAAVAVADTAREFTGHPTRIKWPNDVLLADRKVCGILIEQTQGMVVGIGLNVNQTAEQFAAAGLPGATSLAAASGQNYDRDAVARLLLDHLDAGYEVLLHGDMTLLETSWREQLDLTGEMVSVELADGTVHRGRLRVLSFAGLAVDRPGGGVSRFTPEAVREIRPDRGRPG
jgi:BirA family transcriptional regulator, biotin operon repressor / biotin---[acetyl-CoA-carboxylase] ligase